MAQTPLHANKFGNTPNDPDLFTEAISQSPESLQNVDVAELIGNLRNELEYQYQKQIE